MKFQNIKKLPQAHYSINVPWDGLEDNLDRYIKHYDLDLDPEFQRGHVWEKENQIAYIEFVLSGGESGKDIFLNCPGWQSGDTGQMTLVDGKQRVEAVRKFLDNKVAAFGHYFDEYTDRLPFEADFRVHIASLDNERDVLAWYIALNSGVPHTRNELDRVRKLMK